MSCRSFIVAFLLSLASVAATAADSFDYQLHDLEGHLHKAPDQQGKAGDQLLGNLVRLAFRTA